MVEYVLIIALIFLAIIVGVSLFAKESTQMFSHVSSSIEEAIR